MKPQNVKTNCLVLGNAALIVSNVIKDIAGNDISNSINGSKITRDMIHSLVCQRIMKNLE